MYINDKEHLHKSPALAVKFFLNSPCLAIVTPQTSLVIKYWHPGLEKKGPEKPLSLWSLFYSAFLLALATQPSSVPVFV